MFTSFVFSDIWYALNIKINRRIVNINSRINVIFIKYLIHENGGKGGYGI